MKRLILSRLLISIPLVFVVTALTFVLESIAPGDAARAIVGDTGTVQQYQRLRHELGIDRPLAVQYWHWLDGVLHGTLGASVFSGESVVHALDNRLAVTASLIIGATIVSSVLAIGLGVISAVRGGRLGGLVDVLSLFGLAVPSFWLGLVLIEVFAVKFRLFPATGYTTFSQSSVQWLHSLVLPVITLAIGAFTLLAKQTREAMLDVLNRDFIMNLRVNGLSSRSIVFRHALRNAGPPILTIIGTNFIAMLSGTVLVEAVFVVPGLGGLAVSAAQNHDLPILEGIALYFAAIVVAVNLLVDIGYGLLDPRVRVT